MNKLFYLIITCCTLILVSCESEYSKAVKNGLTSGEIHDDLFLGLKMGQTQKEFFDHCWSLNKKNLVSQGPGNKYAKYYMIPDSTEDMTQKVEVLFYGMFDEQKVMYGMDMKMEFTAWAPWNEKFQSDKLVAFLKDKYMKEEGLNPFLEIDIDTENKAYAKIDGNRQILIYALNDKTVAVKIEDLRKSKTINL